MRLHFNMRYSSIASLFMAFLVVMTLSSAHPGARIPDCTTSSLNQCTIDVDGTQLAQRAKNLLAEEFQISVAEITAVYCCQLSDGRYQYNCTIPVNNNGFVYFTISGGQIIVDDVEGF